MRSILFVTLFISLLAFAASHKNGASCADH